MRHHRQPIELHGWDSQSRVWHGPTELAFSLAECRHIVRKLRNTPGAWYGRLREQEPGELPLVFCAWLHDLGDAGIGVVDLEGSPGGPLEVIAVIPGARIKKLRPEFAFEFVAFLRFLEGPESLGSELALHDYIEKILSTARGSKTIVFSIERRFGGQEIHVAMSRHVGKLIMSMIAWIDEKDSLPK